MVFAHPGCPASKLSWCSYMTWLCNSGSTNNLCLNKGFPFLSFQSFLLEHMPSFHILSFARASFQSSNDIEGVGDRIWIDEDGGEIGGGRGVTVKTCVKLW